MAMLGKAIRMARLVNQKSGKFMAITVDHSLSRGILKGPDPDSGHDRQDRGGTPGRDDDDEGHRGELLVEACGERREPASEVLELFPGASRRAT